MEPKTDSPEVAETVAARPPDGTTGLVVTAGPNRWLIPCDTEAEARDRLAEFRRQHPQAGFWGDFKAEFRGETIG